MLPVGKRHAKTCALFTLLWSKGKVVKMRETRWASSRGERMRAGTKVVGMKRGCWG